MRSPVPGIVALLALSLSATAAAQSGFTVTHKIGTTTPDQVEVVGMVVNDTRAEAVDVSVTVEALNPSGKVIARGVCFVTDRLRGGSSADFSAKVPVVAGTSKYRARVSSYRFIQSVQTP